MLWILIISEYTQPWSYDVWVWTYQKLLGKRNNELKEGHFTFTKKYLFHQNCPLVQWLVSPIIMPGYNGMGVLSQDNEVRRHNGSWTSLTRWAGIWKEMCGAELHFQHYTTLGNMVLGECCVGAQTLYASLGFFVLISDFFKTRSITTNYYAKLIWETGRKNGFKRVS